jgi:enamine deaminase RidA (YjgF/YER057c/UK114 family)
MSNPRPTARRLAYLPDIEPGARRFPNAIRIGDSVYASSQPIVPVVAPAPPRIQDQTHKTFADFVGLLEAVGVHMSDLVKLHTFYVYEGDSSGTTEYWQRMTEVRLQYFANPGPAGTALRVKGAPTSQRLIAIDGIARADPSRRRIMPAHAWDWSMPTPLSQGWRVGDVVYCGGQISADRRGRAVAADDLTQQVINTMEFLRHVLVDGNAGFEDIVSLKIGYQGRGDPVAARAGLAEILRVVRPLLKPGQCTLNCLGVDFLYEGLQLEIDAMALVGAASRRVVTGVDDAGTAHGFATASRVDGLIHIGGLAATEDATNLEGQLRGSLRRLNRTLGDIRAGADDLIKLSVLFASNDSDAAAEYATIHRVLAVSLPTPGPVVTIVRVAGLPGAGQRVQLDGVALTNSP